MHMFYMKVMCGGNGEGFSKMSVSYRTSDAQNGMPCKGKVAITSKMLKTSFLKSLITNFRYVHGSFLFSFAHVGLRIPLFWKDSEHFSTKGSEYSLCHCFSIFSVNVIINKVFL